MLRLLRKFSTKANAKFVVSTNPNVLQDLAGEKYKARKHPGIDNVKSVELPENLIKAAINILQDFPMKKLQKDAVILSRHLRYKVPPMERDQIKDLQNDIYSKTLKKAQAKLEDETLAEDPKFQQSVKDRTIFKLKKAIYNWKPEEYNNYSSLVYLIARFAPDYAVLVRIFSEINKRDPELNPRSIFNFGSGTGTAIWASKLFWEKQIFEYYNVDSSAVMNDLSLLLLKIGQGTKEPILKGVFHRQFLPASNFLYDIVVSSYTLMEFPSFQERMKTVLKLWNKTGKYLVIVENGSNAGFKIINEVRDYVLKISDGNAQIFSPCSHEEPCPRFLTDDTPCNFEVKYKNPFFNEAIETELFSYMVISKGPLKDGTERWPRLVRPTIRRSKHSVCRFCAHGKLSEIIFSASKHGKSTYHCARSAKWGDRLPINVSELNNDENKE